MAITKVSVFLQDTQIGVQTVNDGVAMLFSPGVAIAASGDNPGLVLNTPILLTSVDDALNMGIDEDYDATNTVGLYFNIREFFSRAGTGSRLWVCVFDASTTLTTFISSAAFKTAVRATKAGSFDNRPRLIGVVQKTGTTAPTAPAYFSADTLTAIPAFQAALNSLFNESLRCVGIMDSGTMVYDANITLGQTFNSRAVALAVTTTTPGMTASVGLFLGEYAVIGLSTSAGEVARGPIASDGYLMDATNTSVRTIDPVTYDILGAGQYLFLRERVQEPGVFLNDDATLNDPTKALSQIPYLRVGNSICDLAEWYIQRLINTKVPVTANGDIDGSWKTSVLNDLDSKYLIPRINRGDASAISVDFQAVGNFVETRKVQVIVSILPQPTLQQADVYVFFVSTITA